MHNCVLDRVIFQSFYLIGRLLPIILLILSINIGQAQIWSIASCETGGANTYGPMYSLSTANATNRTAVIYPSSQLTGISGQTLSSIYFERVTATGSMAGTPNFKVYLKEVSMLDWGAPDLVWATETSGSTLVFDGNPAPSVGSSAGWKEFIFSTNFTYTGTQNLAIFFEYTNATASTSITWTYEFGDPCINSANSNTSKYSNNTTGTLSATLASENYRRPLIGFDMILPCYPPASLTATGISPSSANISWTVGDGAPSNGYTWEVRTSGLPGSGATGLAASGSTAAGVTMATASGLASDTDHNLYVRGFCGGAIYSPWAGPTSFKTLCNLFLPPYTQDFASYAGAAPTGLTCWSEYANGSPPGPALEAGSSVWTSDGFANNGTTGAAKILLSVDDDRDWLVSPPFDLTGGPFQLKSDFALTVSAGTGQGVFGSDDQVKVLISTDFGISWVTLETFSVTNTPPNTGQTKVYDLSAYTNMDVIFAFWGNEGTIDDTQTSEFFVDNFVVEVVPSCSAPGSLTATSINNNGATLGWTELGAATVWDLEIILASSSPTGTPTHPGITTNPYVWTGGMPGTAYKFYVRSDCGPIESTWTGPEPFMTTPANDNCAGATELTVDPDASCNQVLNSTTLGSTQTTGETAPTCSATGVNDDVWFSFQATSQTHIVVLTGATNTTAAQVYSGSCGSLVTEVCGSTSGGNLNLIVPGLTAGIVYKVRVYSTSSVASTTTNFAICISTPPPISNDDCTNAIELTVNADMACGTSTIGTTLGATESTNQPDPTCSATGINDDVWFSFVATDVSHVVSISGASVTTTLQVYSGTCGTLATLVCGSTSSGSSNVLAQGLTPSEEYLVRVYSQSSTVNVFSDFTICIGTPPPMSYVSSTTTHPTTAAVVAGTVDQRIIRVAVVVTGATSPLTLTQIDFNTNGSTDPATDIINAKVYYTGTSTTYSTETQFGSTFVSPNGDFSISGSQALIGSLTNATNYFFLAYDVPCASTPPNVLDAEAVQITLGSTYVPTVTAPTGSRAISAAAYTAATAQFSTTDVFTGSIDNIVLRVQLSGCANTEVTSIDFTTGLSTNPASDVSLARVYFTTTTTFDNSIQFGSPLLNPSGSFTITGSQVLTLATGYFWLVYDIAGSATVNNLVDGALTSAVINGVTATPTTSNPTGTRTIKAHPPNDEASNATLLAMNQACTGNMFSNEFATLSTNEPYPSCSGVAVSPVWFKFVAPTSGAVRVTMDILPIGTFTDAKAAIFSATDPNNYATFSLISCDDDGGYLAGDGYMPVVFATGLTGGVTYYIGVDEFEPSTTAGTFCIQVDELSSTMLSTSNTCSSTYQTVVNNGVTNYAGWIPLLDGSSKLVAMVRYPAGGGNPALFTPRQNVHTGAVRQYQGADYLDRNFFINNPTATNTMVQLFFLDTEFNDLALADPSVTSTSDLKITKTAGQTCATDFDDNAAVLLNQISSNSAGGVSWVQFISPSFSNFFIHGGLVALPIDLLSFNAEGMKNYNMVTWQTASETNVAIYLIQRATTINGNFETIGQVEARNGVGESYSFIDHYPKSIGYYRLKMMDLDGQHDYSNTVLVRRTPDRFSILNVYPVPSEDVVNVDITNPESIKTGIVIADITGKTIRTIDIELAEGDQTIQVSLNGLQPGTYFLTILGQVKRVIKL